MRKSKKQKLVSKKTTKLQEIHDYDYTDTTSFINKRKQLTFRSLGLELPKEPPSQVVSIRIPTWMLNQLKSRSSQKDIPYQALIKMILADELSQGE
jgi:predicted DNA binding CopG/RHH family protein